VAPSKQRSGDVASRRGRPPGKFVQHKRMSELRQLLHQHPRGVTLMEIAAHLRITTRSARRYLSEVQLDLEAVPERPGGEKRWRIPAVDVPRRVALRRTQAYALLAARTLFEPMRGSALYEEIDLAANMLLGVAKRPGRGPNAGVAEGDLEQRFRYLPFAPQSYAHKSDDLDNLFHAVADLRPLSCRYPDPLRGVVRLRLHPFALLFYKDAIHCLAREVESGSVGPFRFDAMHDVRCAADEQFDVPDDFRLEDYLQGHFGLWRAEGEPVEVVVDFDAAIADYALTRAVHPSQRVVPLEDGRVRLRLALTNLTEVTAWVLGFGGLAEVRAPAALRKSVADELRRALARYE
jgi:predicted DNA-binding transcriptional regulator YafY